MKLQIKLDKDSTQGFKNFMETIKPKEMTKDEFVLQVFLNGVEATNKRISEEVQKYIEEHPEKLEELGVTDPKQLIPEQYHDTSGK